MSRYLSLLALLACSACASITQGTTQSVTVTTEPPGASSAIQREGQQLAVVNPTPGSVTLDKSSRALSVRCERPGYAAAVTSVPSSIQAMTAGNLVLGGVVGLAVDAASGAMHQYPSNVSLTLPPAAEPPMAMAQPPSGERGRAVR
jgi:hypothetical protein